MALIYCVEDDLGIRELVLCALGTAGHEAKGFENADQFLPQWGNAGPRWQFWTSCCRIPMASPS